MRIGVVGTGHLGNIHLKCLKNTDFQCIGVYDLDQTKSAKAAAEFGIDHYESFQALLKDIDAVIVVSDTTSHYDLACEAIRQSKHVFIEKPVTANVDEALKLKSLVNDNPSLKIQVGHVERYNPAFVSALSQLGQPKFIECHRLANFNPRGNDVSVILDLMIHDLDILLTIVDSEITEVRSNGVSIVSSTPDICNARIEFSNGCVANVTASRISLKQMRKFRIFQEDAYVGIDFLEKTHQVIKLNDHPLEDSMEIETGKGTKYLNVLNQATTASNAIEEELKDFYLAITKDRKPTVNVDHALRVMALAEKIEQRLNLAYA